MIFIFVRRHTYFRVLVIFLINRALFTAKIISDIYLKWMSQHNLMQLDTSLLLFFYEVAYFFGADASLMTASAMYLAARSISSTVECLPMDKRKVPKA
jgi:hypothetical protein